MIMKRIALLLVMALSLAGCRKSEILIISIHNGYESDIDVSSNFYDGTVKSGDSVNLSTAASVVAGIGAPGMDVEELWSDLVIPKNEEKTVTVSVGGKVLRQWTYGDSQEDTPYKISNWKHDSSTSVGNTQYRITYIFRQ